MDRRTRPFDPTGWDAKLVFFYPKPDEHRYPNTDNVGGFVYAKLARDNGTFTFYSGDGRMLHGVYVFPRHSVQTSSKTIKYFYNDATDFGPIEFSILSALVVAALFFTG